MKGMNAMVPGRRVVMEGKDDIQKVLPAQLE
jgi:hypothetical protein